MSLTIPTLASVLSAIGNAHVFAGDPFTASGMSSLGAKEGPITTNVTDEFSDLTAKEVTGPAIHQRTLMGSQISGTLPLIVDAAAALYPKISPTGTTGGGFSSPQAVVTTALLILPDSEVGAGLSYNGTVWAPAAPKHAIWIWRVAFGRAEESWTYENGGKKILSIPFAAMFATNAGVPDGIKVWCRGDPVAQGVSTLRI